jgi:hypothetical protein
MEEYDEIGADDGGSIDRFFGGLRMEGEARRARQNEER